MLCKDCEYFNIKCEPYKVVGLYTEWGQAECKKHNLVTDFKSHKKFETLECVEDKKRMKNSGITLGQILDLLDINRESEEMVEIMNHDGQVQCRAMVCSVTWRGIEDKTINSMQAAGNCLQIWLND